MRIFDAHCDTITKMMEDNSNLYQNDCHVDLQRLKAAGEYMQVFAAFVDAADCAGAPKQRVMNILDEFDRQMELYQEDVMHCRSKEDIEAALSQNKIAALLSIEGGEALEGDIRALHYFYERGVRSICLTWNHTNEISGGIGDGANSPGLTEFGREVVQTMNRLGMAIDVSHLSEAGFWDVLSLSTTPVIASHSNAKKLCSHRRNLSDAQIQAIARNKGAIGINLYPDFLSDTGSAGMDDLLRHIEHISSTAGEDHLGLGADFDGIEKTPTDIHGVQDVDKIWNALARKNYSDEFIQKIASKNFLRVWNEIIR